MTPNKAHQSGYARAFIESSPPHFVNKLHVFLEGSIVCTIANGALICQKVIELASLSNPPIMLAWDESVHDQIVDIFKAIGKALDIYSDAPGQAYKQGFAEGEAKALREWNQSLRTAMASVPTTQRAAEVAAAQASQNSSREMAAPAYKQLQLFDTTPYETGSKP